MNILKSLKSTSKALLGMTVVALVASLLVWSDTAQACCTTPPDGIMGWWTGDENADDMSENGNHATLMNGAQAGMQGYVAGGFQFNGVDGMANTPVVLPPQGTLSMWLNPASLDTIDGIIGTYGMSNGGDRLWINVRGPEGGIGVGPNKIVVNTGSSCCNEIIADSPLAVGTWTHLAFTFDYINDVFTLYLDGQPAATSTDPRNTPTGTLIFGALDSDFGQRFFFDGQIDEVSVHNRVLAASEVLTIYNAGSAGMCAPNSGGGSDLTLTASGFKVKGWQRANLEWSGSSSANVHIYRDGTLITTTANDGFYMDSIDSKGGGSYLYTICEEGTTTCSDEASVVF